MNKVFVYGTLMSGFGANGLLPKTGRKCVTSSRYTLLDLGPFPGLSLGKTSHIEGEVYEVDEKTLKNLDAYEGVPHLYTREKISVLIDGRIESAWAYFLKEPHGEPIESGNWREHVLRHR